MSSNIYIILKLIVPHSSLMSDPKECESTPPVTTLRCTFHPNFRSHASWVYRTAVRRIITACAYAFYHNVTVTMGWCVWQGKGRLPLCFTEQYAITADDGVKVQIPVFLSWATDWPKRSASCPDCITHGEKTPVTTPPEVRWAPRSIHGTRTFTRSGQPEINPRFLGRSTHNLLTTVTELRRILTCVNVRARAHVRIKIRTKRMHKHMQSHPRKITFLGLNIFLIRWWPVVICDTDQRLI